MQLAVDEGEEVSHRTLGIVPVDMGRRLTTQTPVHGLAQDRSTRPVELVPRSSRLVRVIASKRAVPWTLDCIIIH
jgi:hypothetical protein